MPPERAFTADEASPMLKVMSKLHPVTVVDEAPFFRVGWPHLCVMDSPKFWPLVRVLARYPGSGSWYMFSDLPRLCVVVQPNLRHAESPDVPMNEFRARMIAEIPSVARFIDQELKLESRPEQGFEISNQKLELPLIEDRSGPGGGALLVADPAQFVKTGVATSSLDRAVHFWITEQEAEELYQVTHTGADERRSAWQLLAQISEPYTPVVIPPSEVAELAFECDQLRNGNASLTLKNALDRILLICRSAQSYHLGIYVPSP